MRQAGPDKRKTMYSLWFQGHPGPLAASAGSLGASSEPCPSCPPAPRGLLVRGSQQFCFPYFLRGFQGMSPSRVSTPTARSDSQVLPVGRLRGGGGVSPQGGCRGGGQPSAEVKALLCTRSLLQPALRTGALGLSAASLHTGTFEFSSAPSSGGTRGEAGWLRAPRHLFPQEAMGCLYLEHCGVPSQSL